MKLPLLDLAVVAAVLAAAGAYLAWKFLAGRRERRNGPKVVVGRTLARGLANARRAAPRR